MGIWNAATPLGTDFIAQGDDRLRELKAALEEALSHEDSTFPGATPASTPIFIPGFLRGTTASRPTGDSLVSGRLYVNTTLGCIERYNGSAWVSVATDIPAGTKMVFYQASAPTGWTAVALNDKFLRVVTAGGTGGTSGGSGLVPSGTITLAHTHGGLSHTHDMANHTHAGPSHTHSVPRDGWGQATTIQDGRLLVEDGGGGGQPTATGDNTTGASGTGNTGVPSTNTSGATAPTTDSQLSNIAFQYADLIIATKD